MKIDSRTTSLGFLLATITLSLADSSDFPQPYNSEPETSGPLPASEAVQQFELPPGFNASVFAAEPDVQNPIAMAWDSRGRLWIAENYTYAERARKFDQRLRDRILIFEDADGDGRFDSRKVFTDELQMLSSIEIAHGGVWVAAPPQLLFIPDYDADDVPDAAAEVVLDGFAISPENYHTFVNGLRFGPDGWLYGRCGASSVGEIGIPGTPADQRIPIRGTLWRYHPTRRTVEVLSSGTTNPWGHDWNEFGELFFINTVNGHLWHSIPGAHFMRPHTVDPNPHVYTLIDQHADHWHFDTAEGWTKSRDGKAAAYGGGHAHVGMTIYLGNNWPAEYRGRLLTWNLHGRRVNQELLERHGSGYIARHAPDLFVSKDSWLRGMELSYGPDGAVFALDWSDAGECHESTGVHRTSGRIYKFSYGKPNRTERRDLARMSSADLVKLHTHSNEWFVRRARLELDWRANNNADLEPAIATLRVLFAQHPDLVVKLRSLWSLYVIGAADDAFLQAQLRHPNEHVRAWAIRFLTDALPLDTVMSQRPLNPLADAQVNKITAILPELLQLAREDNSGLVRLVLASTLQRLPVPQRVPLAAALMARDEDASDHNLPLLIWYGLIPVIDDSPAALPLLAVYSELPLTRRFISRRLAEEGNPAPLNELLLVAAERSETFQFDILSGFADGFAGRRKAPKPYDWDAIAKKLQTTAGPRLHQIVRELSVLFGDGRALEEVKEIALDPQADIAVRKTALQTLVDSRPPDLRQVCEQLLSVRFVNPVAAQGLATFADPAVAQKLSRAYSQFHPSERAQLIAALVSRPLFASALLDAIAEKRIPRTALSPFDARRIRNFNESALNQKLSAIWGEFREPAADKQELVAKFKSEFTPVALAKADKSRGRVVFNETCGPCHTLYGHGGSLGPDLTGAGRDNLDYLLEKLADPSAVVTADFRMSIVNLNDGRVLNGIITTRTARTLTLKTITETQTIEHAEIESVQQSSLSMMPEGLLEGLTLEQRRDLIAYLMHKAQAPLPPSIAPENSVAE